MRERPAPAPRPLPEPVMPAPELPAKPTPPAEARTPAKKPRPRPPSARAAVLRERRRVAEALHNTICQELTGIGLMASAAAHRLHANHPEAEATLREIAALVQHAGKGLQGFIRSLRP